MVKPAASGNGNIVMKFEAEVILPEESVAFTLMVYVPFTK